MNSNEVDLNSLEDDFQKIKRAYASECDEIVDDDYRVLVKYVGLENSKNGIPQLMWVLEIISGKYSGCVLYRHNSLTNSESALRLLDADLSHFVIRE